MCGGIFAPGFTVLIETAIVSLVCGDLLKIPLIGASGPKTADE